VSAVNPDQFLPGMQTMTGQPLPLMQALPPEFGKTPIPEGHVRLHHRTKDPTALPSIRQNGLQVAHAVGHTYGEPNMVWATGQAGEYAGGKRGYDETHHVEFHANPNTDLDIGRGGSQEQLEDRSVTMVGDVPASNIISAHEPWHPHARYVQREALPEVRSGMHDSLMSDSSMPQYGPAIRYAKGPEFKDTQGRDL